MLQEFVEEVEKLARDVCDEMHTALPGKVVSFDGKDCTATIQPVGKYITSSGTKLNYPQLTEVPLCFPYCQMADIGIAFPVKAGDSCLIIISEIELDEWRSGAESDVESSLKFDLTSAIAIPGLMKSVSVLMKQAVGNNAVVVGAGETVLQVSKSGVKITGNLSVSGDIAASGNVTGENL